MTNLISTAQKRLANFRFNHNISRLRKLSHLERVNLLAELAAMITAHYPVDDSSLSLTHEEECRVIHAVSTHLAIHNPPNLTSEEGAS